MAFSPFSLAVETDDLVVRGQWHGESLSIWGHQLEWLSSLQSLRSWRQLSSQGWPGSVVARAPRDPAHIPVVSDAGPDLWVTEGKRRCQNYAHATLAL